MRKRYMLTLEEDLVNEFRGHCKTFKLASGQLSSSTEDMLKELNQMFKRCKETGKLTITDLFQMMGQNIQEAMENEEQTPETKGVVQTLTKKKS